MEWSSCKKIPGNLDYLHHNKILRVSEHRERNKIITTVSLEWKKGMVKTKEGIGVL